MGGNVERHIGDDDRDGAAIEAMRDAEPTSDDVSFQDRVDPWMQACFGAEISADKLERGDRLLEEVLEKVGEMETTAGPWALDTSTGSEILVKGGCSVIEGEDARYLLRLIAADTSTPAPDAVARLVEAARALGAMPEGYCFCSANRVGDDSKIHEPECADLRAALVAKEGDGK